VNLIQRELLISGFIVEGLIKGKYLYIGNSPDFSYIVATNPPPPLIHYTTNNITRVEAGTGMD
jgi:hypothetical protein